MDEVNLIKLAQENDKNALSILLNDNYNFVFSYLLKLTKNYEISKDITQDTMVKAILNIKNFNNKSKFSTWLITIASNQYKNAYKRNKKIVNIGNDKLVDYIEVNYSEMTLEEKIILNDDYLKVLSELDKFTNKQKMPFILKHYYGYSYEEISVILKCPIGTIKSRIHNTIKKLRTNLEGEFSYE